MALAEEILAELSPRGNGARSKTMVKAEEFVVRAREEIGRYQLAYPDLRSTVELRDDVSGLLVVRGNLLVENGKRFDAARVKPLLQHEIGTHVLTYFNGRAQPFKQLYVGLSGYEELQEGLAVLAEYLVGGLNQRRLRILAARVVAAKRLTEGAAFEKVFRELNERHGFSLREAFTITMRVFRGGGLTKDACYLRGLTQVLRYLSTGGDLETLLVGKIAVSHVNIIKELQWREVLAPPPLRPFYLDEPGAREKLQELRSGLTPVDLAKKRKTK